MSGVELQGVDQMLAAIQKKLTSGVARLENQGLREAGEILAEAQRSHVPVSTIDHLHMREDISVSRVRRIDGMKVIKIGPGKKTAWRAHFSEFGTKYSTAEPFIYPAYHENKQQIIRLLASVQREGMT